MQKSLKTKALATGVAAAAIMSFSSTANAHLVTFGWLDNGNGTVTLYGEHWHGDLGSPYTANDGIHIGPEGGASVLTAAWIGVINNVDVLAMGLTGYSFDVGNFGGGTYDDWMYTAPVALGNGKWDFITGPNCCIDTMFEPVTIEVTGVTSVPDGTIGPGGVPEPSTWAMMLLGFGALGAALRRKPKVSYNFA